MFGFLCHGTNLANRGGEVRVLGLMNRVCDHQRHNTRRPAVFSEGNGMDPLTVSAQFSAYVWYSHGKPDSPVVRARANRFAQEHWPAFLSNAHEGLGRLLLRLADNEEDTPTATGQSSTEYEPAYESALALC
jgi:hypothetical protein